MKEMTEFKRDDIKQKRVFAKASDGCESPMPSIEELAALVKEAEKKLLSAKTKEEYEDLKLDYETAKAVADAYIYDAEVMEMLS